MNEHPRAGDGGISPPRQRSDGRRRTLLASVNPAYAEALAALLEVESDFRLLGVADSAAEVLERAAAEQPDLVVVDVGLPSLAESLLMQALRDHAGDTVIAAVGGTGSPQDEEMVLSEGAHGYAAAGVGTLTLLDWLRQVCPRPSIDLT